MGAGGGKHTVTEVQMGCKEQEAIYEQYKSKFIEMQRRSQECDAGLAKLAEKTRLEDASLQAKKKQRETQQEHHAAQRTGLDHRKRILEEKLRRELEHVKEKIAFEENAFLEEVARRKNATQNSIEGLNEEIQQESQRRDAVELYLEENTRRQQEAHDKFNAEKLNEMKERMQLFSSMIDEREKRSVDIEEEQLTGQDLYKMVNENDMYVRNAKFSCVAPSGQHLYTFENVHELCAATALLN